MALKDIQSTKTGKHLTNLGYLRSRSHFCRPLLPKEIHSARAVFRLCSAITYKSGFASIEYIYVLAASIAAIKKPTFAVVELGEVSYDVAFHLVEIFTELNNTIVLGNLIVANYSGER